VETVRTLAEDIQQQIDFAGGIFFQLNHTGLVVGHFGW
jgi:hypothetical protein